MAPRGFLHVRDARWVSIFWGSAGAGKARPGRTKDVLEMHFEQAQDDENDDDDDEQAMDQVPPAMKPPSPTTVPPREP